MDACEATKVVMSRVHDLDPENASKIMGLILIQDDGDKEMIRLALGPEALLVSCVDRLKACLGLPSNTSSANSSGSLQSPVVPNGPFPPRVVVPNGPRPDSYAAVLNGGAKEVGDCSSGLRFYGGGDFGDQLSFLDESAMDPMISPSGRSDSLVFPYGEGARGIPSPQPHPFHRRSCSVNDAGLEEGGGGGGFGWKPCMYFARGYCKNGDSCKFLHCDKSEMVEAAGSLGSAGIEEFFRMKAIQQQRFPAMASGGHHSFPYSKSVNILNDNQRCGPRNVFSQTGLAPGLNSSSRQIYLTFPADSTFKEEDVSTYFSMFGPVHDVRIPYQTKRMFGFVTFVYPETVKRILDKGNPHFVCDSRVLVKPYKEKGKILERRHSHQQHDLLERRDYSACLSPSEVDSRELFDIPIGSRMLFNTQQEMMLRRKFEHEAEIQHTLELQSRRMMNMKLVDLEIPQNSSHRFLPSLFTNGPISSSPRQQQFLRSHNFMHSPNATNQHVLQEFDDGQEASNSPQFAADIEKSVLEETESYSDNYILFSKKHQHANDDASFLPESCLEHILPHNLFASPTKLATEKRQSFFSAEADNNTITVTDTRPNNAHVVASSSSSPRMTSLFYSDATRLEATEM